MTVNEYELLDSGCGEKLERFGKYVLRRPCAQAVWLPRLDRLQWDAASASFDRVSGNRWHNRTALPDSWAVSIDGIKFKLSGTDFGHLGVFPEQRQTWSWIAKTVADAKKAGRTLSVLNLFAYSGGSTLAPALAGAQACHLDASRGMVDWARENAKLNGLADAPIRWITDDVMKFMGRELKRGTKYDTVILDPPSFGRGKQGEVYKVERDIIPTLELCRDLLSDKPSFLILSSHTPGFSPVVLQNLLRQIMKGREGGTECGEMLLTGARDVPPLPNGTWARWSAAP